jgi:hypothetical protein
MTVPNDTPVFPLPALLTDGVGTPSDRDPKATSEGGPQHNRGTEDSADAGIITAYAQQLWGELSRVAQYLHDLTPQVSTDEQWAQWRTTYADVLSVMAGPAGDQGFGAQEATRAFQNRAS